MILFIDAQMRDVAHASVGSGGKDETKRLVIWLEKRWPDPAPRFWQGACGGRSALRPHGNREHSNSRAIKKDKDTQRL